MSQHPVSHPILYSFRRCPYAMRARLAILSAGFKVELREILLRDKAPEFIAASPKATVPVLVLPDGTIIDESLDVMLHVLGQSDPESLLTPTEETLADMLALISENDGSFKRALDRYKYANRYEGADPISERNIASSFLHTLDNRLRTNSGGLFGARLSLVDLAILPFVRQFANVDRPWFDSQDWPDLMKALEAFTASGRFASIMLKYTKWQSGDEVIWFGEAKN
ncbi:glutathione S-transferase [Pararhizobium sp. IMCC21322]|uniref:glutathione S-transferase n=1 Tax=Pararhizobium sp. IMCC21322 TaxID=3067903 RepID=UPI00274078D6|nr:glutathione S-transferase [Pararhizobium sp. IMCC21322]